MATPVAHSLVGLAFGLARWRLPQAGGRWQPLLACMLLANAPDIDYFYGLLWCGRFNAYHQTVTHTAVWVLVLTLALWLWARWRGSAEWPFFFLLALLGSHLLIDWLTVDTSPPVGMMLGWPFSARFWHAPWPIFMAPSKADWYALWSLHNLRVMAVEMALTVPLPLLAWLIKRRGWSLLRLDRERRGTRMSGSKRKV